jgi:hypothetical protein
MQETLQLDRLKCAGRALKLTRTLAPVKGLNAARVKIGFRSVVVDYDDAVRGDLDAALAAGGFGVVQRAAGDVDFDVVPGEAHWQFDEDDELVTEAVASPAPAPLPTPTP